MPQSRQSKLSVLDSTNIRVTKETKKAGTFKIGEMSPEARKAMLLTKLDNVISPISPTSNQTTKLLKTTHLMHTSNTLAMIGRACHGVDRNGKPSVLSTDSGINVTTMSQSTVSYTAKTFSVSTDSCYNYGDCSKKLDSKDHPSQLMTGIEKTSVCDSIKECYKTVDISDETISGPSLCSADAPLSFVLTLDRALEENRVSRLQGDITDTKSISETGHVRALNGGRLANAQEVVVNVCYDDDKELVFHDDNERNINTAKTISHICVDIWMAYNEHFDPDLEPTNELNDSMLHKQEARSTLDKETLSPLKPREIIHKNSTDKIKKMTLNKHTTKTNKLVGNDSTLKLKTCHNTINPQSKSKCYHSKNFFSKNS